MIVKCGVCGEGFEAKRSNATYCSARCRKRASRSKSALVIDLTSKRQRGRAPEPTLPSTPQLVTATEEALRGVGKVDTVLGQQALALARRIASPGESALAPLSREFRAIMDIIMGQAREQVDPLDELRAWRERRDAD